MRQSCDLLYLAIVGCIQTLLLVVAWMLRPTRMSVKVYVASICLGPQEKVYISIHDRFPLKPKGKIYNIDKQLEEWFLVD